MKFSQFFFSMSRDEQDEFAKRAGTTGGYLRTHVFVPSGRRKIPRKEKIDALVIASKGVCTFDDVLMFLYKSEDGREAA